MLSIFKPAAHKARLPAAEIDPLYRRLRWQIFIGIFFHCGRYANGQGLNLVLKFGDARAG